MNHNIVSPAGRHAWLLESQIAMTMSALTKAATVHATLRHNVTLFLIACSYPEVQV
jgi:hypothetical protein